MKSGNFLGKSKSRQSGFLIIGCALAVAVAAIIMAVSVEQSRQQRRYEHGDLLASALSEATRAVEMFVIGYHAQLSSNIDAFKPLGDSSENVPIPIPHAPDFKAILKLVEGYGISAYAPLIRNARYAVKLDVPYFKDSSCYGKEFNSDGGKCNIRGLVYVDEPYPSRANPDFAAIGRAARALGANGGYSPRNEPSHFIFTNLTAIRTTNLEVKAPNPMPGVAGILVKRFGNWEKGSSAYAGAGVDAGQASDDQRPSSLAAGATAGVTPSIVSAQEAQYNELPPLFQDGDWADSKASQEERKRRTQGKHQLAPVLSPGGGNSSMLGNFSMQGHTFNSGRSSRNPIKAVGDLYINRLSVPVVSSLRGLHALSNFETESVVTNTFLPVLDNALAARYGPVEGDSCGKIAIIALGLERSSPRRENPLATDFVLLQCQLDQWRLWSNSWVGSRKDDATERVISDGHSWSVDVGEWRFCSNVTPKHNKDLDLVPVGMGPGGRPKWAIEIINSYDGGTIKNEIIRCFN